MSRETCTDIASPTDIDARPADRPHTAGAARDTPSAPIGYPAMILMSGKSIRP